MLVKYYNFAYVELIAALLPEGEMMGVQKFMMLFSLMYLAGGCAAAPSEVAVRTCLEQDIVYRSVSWHAFDIHEYIFRDNYRNGFDAVYSEAEGRKFGIATKGLVQAMIYNGALYPIARARAAPGFEKPTAEVDQLLSGWGMVAESAVKYLCINFPTGGLGQSGSFQYVRNVYLLQISPKRSAGQLYGAIGKIRGARE